MASRLACLSRPDEGEVRRLKYVMVDPDAEVVTGLIVGRGRLRYMLLPVDKQTARLFIAPQALAAHGRVGALLRYAV